MQSSAELAENFPRERQFSLSNSKEGGPVYGDRHACIQGGSDSDGSDATIVHWVACNFNDLH